MKKILILLVLVVFSGCNDGDFDVPAFEFSQTVSTCGDVILYVTNRSKTEVLALTMNPVHFTSKVGEAEIALGETASTTVIKATYRIFNTGIGTDYFCQSIPPTSPKVVKELIAEGGKALITTIAVKNDSDVVTGYTYTISFTDLFFLDGTERVYFQTFKFGSISATI